MVNVPDEWLLSPARPPHNRQFSQSDVMSSTLFNLFFLFCGFMIFGSVIADLSLLQRGLKAPSTMAIVAHDNTEIKMLPKLIIEPQPKTKLISICQFFCTLAFGVL